MTFSDQPAPPPIKVRHPEGWPHHGDQTQPMPHCRRPSPSPESATKVSAINFSTKLPPPGDRNSHRSTTVRTSMSLGRSPKPTQPSALHPPARPLPVGLIVPIVPACLVTSNLPCTLSCPPVRLRPIRDQVTCLNQPAVRFNQIYGAFCAQFR